MPTTWKGLTRVLIDGIPAWRSTSGELFYYDQNLTGEPLKIGTVADGWSETWAETLEERLHTYRDAQTPRVRAAGGAAKKN